MKTVDSIWDAYIDPDWLIKIDQTPFMQGCIQGTATRAELLRFAVQHFFYSRHFTRYLCALIANLASDEDRLLLTANLFEEMGLGEVGSLPHSRIYQQMLQEFGVDPKQHTPLVETQQLTESMMAFCANKDPVVGLGALCLGAEAIVPHLYSRIVKGFEAAGYKECTLSFFYLHIDGDDGHAETMKKIIDREIKQDPSRLRTLQASGSHIIERRADMLKAITLNAQTSIPYSLHGGFVSGVQF